MKAGTLEIELLTNLAKLQADMEQVKKSVGSMTEDVGRKARAANDNINRIGTTNRLAAHHTQNLAFQFQDLGIQMAMAAGSAHPLRMGMMALMQQGAQIQGIMSQAGIGVGGLTKELGRMAGKWGPWAAAIGGAVLLLDNFTDSVNEAADTDAFIKSLGLTAKEMKELEGTAVGMGDVLLGTWDVVSAGLWNAFGPALTKVGNFFALVFGEIGAEVRRRTNVIIGMLVGAFEGISATWRQLPEVFAEAFVNAVNFGIRAINDFVRDAVNTLNLFADAANKVFGTSFGMIEPPQIAEYEDAYRGAGAAAGAAFSDAFGRSMGRDYIGEFAGAVGEAAIARNEADLRRQARELIDERSDRAGRKPGKSDAEREMERLIAEAKRFAEALELETSRIGKTTIEIKQMEIAAAAAIAPTRELRQRILDAGRAWESAFRAQADADFLKNVIRPLEQELALLALIGPARDKAALEMEEEAFKAKALEDGVTDVNAAWAEYLRLHTAIIDAGSMLEREREEAELLARELDRIIGAVGSLGGLGGVVGTLLGVSTGRIGAIGGPFGDLLNIQTGTAAETIRMADGTEQKTGRMIARTLGDELRQVFKLDGEFGKTMSSLLQGAGTGMIAANAIFGQQNTIEQLGAGIGGALGQVGGEALGKALGSSLGALGSAAGPIGSIVGSILGSVLGSALSSTPRGSATIGGAGGALGVTGTAGNSSARVAAATRSANGIIDALSSLADELGATIDPSRGAVSIGIRDGNFRVDTTGRGVTKTKKGAIDFGEDAEAAAYFAMMDLIKDGVLVGLREGTERLLKNAKDVETGISKALAFEGVFKDLQALKDPLGAALDNLDKEFERLRKIFAEAGAAAGEYAQLEELYQLRRQEALERANQAALDKVRDRREMEIQILQLLGREQDAVTASRELELAGLEESLKPLQRMIYQLQDARKIMEQFEPLAADLRAFRQELVAGAGGELGFGAVRSRFRATASLAASGDASAMGMLRGDASAFLEAAKANAGSALDYQRAVGEVLGAVDRSIFAADAQVDYAQMQLDAIQNSANIMVEMKDQLVALTQQQVDTSAELLRLMKRFEGDGFLVRTDDDTPLKTEAV